MSVNNKNLYIVKTPLQVINSIEAANYFKLKNNTIIVVQKINKRNTQMDSLVELFEWDEIIRFETYGDIRDFFYYISFVKKLQKDKYENIFFSRFGSIQRLILSNVKKEKVYYIDDGVETITIYNNLLVQNKINKLDMRQFTRYRFKLVCFNINIKDNINLFTYFDLKPFGSSEVVPNRLQYFRETYMQKSIAKDEIYILGQPLIERKFLDKEIYLGYIKYLIKSSNKKIIYIPHVSEKKQSGVYDIKEDNFSILNPNMPIELYFLKNSILPTHIISFFTTAFFTLKFFYPESKIESIHVPDSLILKRNEVVKEQYDYIDKFGINLWAPLKTIQTKL